MEKFNFTFSGNTNSEETEKLKKSLASNPLIARLFKENEIPVEEIDKHPYRLERFLNGIEVCKGCKGLEHCKQKQSGYFESLTYHGVLEDQLVRCKYAKQKDQEEKHLKNYLVSDLGSDFTSVYFDSFDLTKENEEYIKVFVEVLECYKNEQGVYLYGRMGNGKTTLSACALNEAARSGKKVAFVQCSRLSQRVSTGFLSEAKPEIDRLTRADFVVFDDIGAEEVTERYRSILLGILDARMQNHSMTWFTSNEDHKSLLEHYRVSSKSVDSLEAMRILERIQALSKPIQLTTSDRRTLYSTAK